MTGGERYDHACAWVTLDDGAQGILVAGGSNFDNAFLPDALFFDWSQRVWFPAGALYSPRSSHALAASLSGMPAVIGGNDFVPFKKESSEVEIYSGGQWADTRTRMNTARMYFSLLAVPDDTFQCKRE